MKIGVNICKQIMSTIGDYDVVPALGDGYLKYILVQYKSHIGDLAYRFLKFIIAERNIKTEHFVLQYEKKL